MFDGVVRCCFLCICGSVSGEGIKQGEHTHLSVESAIETAFRAFLRYISMRFEIVEERRLYHEQLTHFVPRTALACTTYHTHMKYK